MYMFLVRSYPTESKCLLFTCTFYEYSFTYTCLNYISFVLFFLYRPFSVDFPVPSLFVPSIVILVMSLLGFVYSVSFYPFSSFLLIPVMKVSQTTFYLGFLPQHRSPFLFYFFVFGLLHLYPLLLFCYAYWGYRKPSDLFI